MSNCWPFSLLNDERTSKWLRVEHQPDKPLRSLAISGTGSFWSAIRCVFFFVGTVTWQVSILKTDHVGPQHPNNLFIDIRALILNSNGWESKWFWKKWSLFKVAMSIWCYIVYHKQVEDEPSLTQVFQMDWYLFALLWKWNMLPIAHQNAPNTRNLHWDHFASFEWTSWLQSYV